MPHADPLGTRGAAQPCDQRLQPTGDLGRVGLEAAQGAEREVARARGLPTAVDDHESQRELGVGKAAGRRHEIGLGLVLVEAVPAAETHALEGLGEGLLGAQAPWIVHGPQSLPNRSGHEGIGRITGAQHRERPAAKGPRRTRRKRDGHAAGAKGDVGAAHPTHGAARGQRQQHGVIRFAARNHQLRLARDEVLLLPEHGPGPPWLGADDGHALLDARQDRREPHAILRGEWGFLAEIERDHRQAGFDLTQDHGRVHLARAAREVLLEGRRLCPGQGGRLPGAGGRQVEAAQFDFESHPFHQGLLAHQHVDRPRDKSVRPYRQVGRRGSARKHHNQAREPSELGHGRHYTDAPRLATAFPRPSLPRALVV